MYCGCSPLKRLIVNADDFGFTSGVNAGILRGFREGIVTSATILANGDAFEEAAAMARAQRGLSVGCHLALVGARPLAKPADVPSLIDRDGLMPRTLWQLVSLLVRGVLRVSDIEHEFRVQLERVRAAGVQPTHLDTHKHAHSHPRVMEAMARVAREAGIRWVRNPFETPHWPAFPGPAARRRRCAYLKQYGLAMGLRVHAARFRLLADANGLSMPDHFAGMSLTGMLDGPALAGAIRSVRDGLTELVCHPGVYDGDLEAAPTRLKREREQELAALTDPEVRRCIRDAGIVLVGYGELG